MYEDADDLLGDPQNIEEIVDNEQDAGLFLEDEDENENGDAENESGAEEVDPRAPAGKPVDPKKKRIVQRAQPKLNPERLMGPRGIATLETVFKDMKFLGKGHEREDLNQVMKRLEHWAHRLFPRLQFDDCLEKIESLGHKKPVMTYVKKIRIGMVSADELAIPSEVVQDDGMPACDDEPPVDEFDALISQQLSHIQSKTSANANSSLSQTTTMANASPMPSQPATTLTAEQRERMLQNRMLAEERRLARMKAEHEKKLNNVEVASFQIPCTSNEELSTPLEQSNCGGESG